MGRAAGSILSVGTSTVPVLPFSSSASSLLLYNIPFSAFSAPGISEASFSTTPNTPFLGGDGPVRVCHWATSVRTGFYVFFLRSLGCLAPCSGTWTQQLQRVRCCCQTWSLCWPCPFPDNLWTHSMIPHISCENKPFISALPVTTALPGRFFLSPCRVPEGLWWETRPDISQSQVSFPSPCRMAPWCPLAKGSQAWQRVSRLVALSSRAWNWGVGW